MKYAKMRKMDVANGEGLGVALFVQGCDKHCNGCFNVETWDFDKGYEWNSVTKQQFITFVARPYIKRVSLLGGEPLHPENVRDVADLVRQIKKDYPDKCIWLYTGYTFEEIYPINKPQQQYVDITEIFRREIIGMCDVLVDGDFQINKTDFSYKWAGSTNQRVIDIQSTLQEGCIILHK